MDGMSATDQLKEEHKVIERMLDVLRVASDRLERGEEERIGEGQHQHYIDLVGELERRTGSKG